MGIFDDDQDPICPNCLASLGWSKVDSLVVADVHFTERQLECSGCGWVGCTAFFPRSDASTNEGRAVNTRTPLAVIK